MRRKDKFGILSESSYHNSLNADLIAGGLSPFSPERAALQAGKLLLQQIDHFAKRKLDFGFETTLSGVTYRSLFRRLKKQGYQIHLFFLWLPDVELALSRIRDRVKRGGHDIPEKTVRRRFVKGIRNFFYFYRPLLHVWSLWDNSQSRANLIATGESNQKINIINQELYQTIRGSLGEI